MFTTIFSEKLRFYAVTNLSSVKVGENAKSMFTIDISSAGDKGASMSAPTKVFGQRIT
jgi:hypothetical protein